MDIQELLIPRWKVIADWPGSGNLNFKVGDIISDNGRAAATNQDGVPQFIVKWPDYPHLFVCLQWWQYREPEDMPEYVRFGEFHRRHAIYKIKEWHLQGIYGIDAVCAIAESPVDYLLRFGIDNSYPATESEYLSYINQKP